MYSCSSNSTSAVLPKPRRFMARATEKPGQAAGRGDAHLAGTGASVDAGARPPGPAPRLAHGPKAHDGTITTEAPDVMWGTDMTATVTVAESGEPIRLRGRSITARACIGLHAVGNRFEALEPIRQGIRERGGIGEGVARGLRLRHDHVVELLGRDFQQEVVLRHRKLSFVREPEGNGVAERFIRTLKEHLLLGAELRDDARSSAWPSRSKFKRDVQRAVDAESTTTEAGPGAATSIGLDAGGVEANTANHCPRTLGQYHFFTGSLRSCPSARDSGESGH